MQIYGKCWPTCKVLLHAEKNTFILIKYALRDIKDLIEKGILRQEESGGL
jgi:hypothetical protein